MVSQLHTERTGLRPTSRTHTLQFKLHSSFASFSSLQVFGSAEVSCECRLTEHSVRESREDCSRWQRLGEDISNKYRVWNVNRGGCVASATLRTDITTRVEPMFGRHFAESLLASASCDQSTNGLWKLKSINYRRHLSGWEQVLWAQHLSPVWLWDRETMVRCLVREWRVWSTGTSLGDHCES